MNQHTKAIGNEATNLADDARALIHATSDAAEEKIVEARKRLASTLEKGKEGLEHLRDKAVQGAKVADHAVHNHLYASIGIAFGVGTLIGGLLVARR